MKNDPTPEQRELLIEAARQARKWAYAPYSHYMVGAALLTTSGKVYDGVNVENAVFPLTTCAERTAIIKAVSEGEKEFQAMAIVTDNAGAPCGSCRQVMAEFGLDMLVIVVDKDGVVRWEKTVAELLPESFTPSDLPR